MPKAVVRMVPTVNQIDVHLHFVNAGAREASQGHRIAVEAWSPLGQGNLLTDPTVARMAAACAKTAAQVTLALAHPARTHCHPEVDAPWANAGERRRVGLALSAGEVAAIDALNQGEDGRIGPHPDTFEGLPPKPIAALGRGVNIARGR